MSGLQPAPQNPAIWVGYVSPAAAAMPILRSPRIRHDGPPVSGPSSDFVR
jgi:hypothetical protein